MMCLIFKKKDRKTYLRGLITSLDCQGLLNINLLLIYKRNQPSKLTKYRRTVDNYNANNFILILSLIRHIVTLNVRDFQV